MTSKLHAMLQSHGMARLFSLTDQGAQGVANILATAMLGRILPIGQFGDIGMAVGVYYFVAGFHRSAVVLPYITEHVTHGSPCAERRYHSDWWWFNVMVACALAMALLVLAGGLYLVLPAGSRWGVASLLLGALITPPLLLAEQARRWLYKIGRADAAALVSVLYAVVLVAAAIILPNFLRGEIAGALAWAVAGLAGATLPLLTLRLTRFSGARSLDCFNRHRRFATWLSLTIIPYVFYSSATVVILIGLINGPLAAGVFTAARTLTNPAVSIVSAVDSVDKPRAARALATGGLAGLHQAVGRTRLFLVVVTGAYLGLVAFAAQPLLDLAFHHRYSGIALEVRVLAAAIFLFCLNQPSETMLIMLRASATMFATRSATAVLTVVLLIAGSSAGVTGMALGIAVAQAANLVFLMVGAQLAERRQALHWAPA